ncbi:uncharacterized protein LOC117644520 [Thrips palmi]|uniref:Poly [ADP-ribose] polymerase n=1 Tax=Thrips palmi TaxID=161013 RepID=A0A6P8YSC1_THRPL|nr:uncharacterized protein LOC117644520 [Thrips palmi]
MASVERIKLDPQSAEYKGIAQKFNSKYIVKFKKCTILSIEKVKNEALDQRFQSKRQWYEDKHGHVKIVKGWHGTVKENVASILKNNFDESKNFGRCFGPGVSFSSLPSYAYHFCDKKTPEACMLLADVLVSNVLELPASEKYGILRVPPCVPGTNFWYDTVAKDKDRMDVFVKQDKDAFLPTHVVHFKRADAPPQAQPAPAANSDLHELMESLSLYHDNFDLIDHLWSYDNEDHCEGDETDQFLHKYDSNQVVRLDDGSNHVDYDYDSDSDYDYYDYEL